MMPIVNGWKLIQKHVLFVRIMLREALDVILFIANLQEDVGRIFAMFASSHGSHFIKITINATYIIKKLVNKENKRF